MESQVQARRNSGRLISAHGSVMPVLQHGDVGRVLKERKRREDIGSDGRNKMLLLVQGVIWSIRQHRHPLRLGLRLLPRKGEQQQQQQHDAKRPVLC